MNGKGFGAFGKERPAGPIKSIFILIIRVLLIGLFLYVTYLGFVWRKPRPASQKSPGGSISSQPAKSAS